MKRPLSYLRKVVALAVGVPLLVVGIILIPLPGPGILVCFAGLFVLSLEFDWAKSHMERSKTHLKKLTDKAKTTRPKQ